MYRLAEDLSHIRVLATPKWWFLIESELQRYGDPNREDGIGQAKA